MAYLNVREGRIVSGNGKGKKLTGKMLSFIDAYFGEACFQAPKAYALSRYESNNRNLEIKAAELMQHPLIQEEIKRRHDARADKSEVKAEFLINKLMEIIRDTQQENPQAALRAIELAGKSIALWKERQEISGPDGGAIEHEQRVKESVVEFTDRLNAIANKRDTGRTGVAGRNTSEPEPRGTGNVTQFPRRGDAS